MSRFSLRVRLAALISLPIILSGALLLAICYALVASSLSAPLPRPAVPEGVAPVPVMRADAGLAPGPAGGGVEVATMPRRSIDLDATQRALVDRTRTQLLGHFALVLAGSVAIAAVLSWLLATRLLGALRRATAVAQHVGHGALDARIGLEGPRDEVRELTDAIDAMLARLDAVFSAQRSFIANASHELRTPLTAMRAELEVLCADPGAAVADVQAATRVLRRQLASSEELIDALLVLAKSEPELLAREPVDLAALVASALAEARSGIELRGLRVECRADAAPASGDRRLMARLVANLITNAVTHNHPQGWIAIETAGREGRAVLTVSNSGPAVSDEDLASLTQPFRRGGQARVGTGHGLGLAIVAAVARAHGAELDIGNPDTGGLRVEVAWMPAD